MVVVTVMVVSMAVDVVVIGALVLVAAGCWLLLLTAAGCWLAAGGCVVGLYEEDVEADAVAVAETT